MKYMPKIDIPEYRTSEDRKKINYIVYVLSDMNYDVGTARDTIKVIEERGVDKFNFDYPYGSFEEYKKHVLAGEYDRNFEVAMRTPEEKAELDKAIKEGRVWARY